MLRCWNVYFRGGGQRNQDLLESGHTITPAAKNSLPHPCPCAVEDMPAADSDGLTTLSLRIEKNRDNATASQAMRSMTPWIARRTPPSV